MNKKSECICLDDRHSTLREYCPVHKGIKAQGPCPYHEDSCPLDLLTCDNHEGQCPIFDGARMVGMMVLYSPLLLFVFSVIYITFTGNW